MVPFQLRIIYGSMILAYLEMKNPLHVDILSWSIQTSFRFRKTTEIICSLIFLSPGSHSWSDVNKHKGFIHITIVWREISCGMLLNVLKGLIFCSIEYPLLEYLSIETYLVKCHAVQPKVFTLLFNVKKQHFFVLCWKAWLFENK